MTMNQHRQICARSLAACFMIVIGTATFCHAWGQNPLGGADPFGAANPFEVVDPFGGAGPIVDVSELALKEYASEMERTEAANGLQQSESSETVTPEQQVGLESVQAYLAIKSISRSPSAILQQLAGDGSTSVKPSIDTEHAVDQESDEEGADGESKKQINRIAELQSQLIRGDWKAVKTHLASLPKPAAPLIYNHVLTLLSKGRSIRPEEIPAIADASPEELTAEQCGQLGALLSSSMVHLDQPRSMLEAIAAGTGRLGGADPKRRSSAARLLLAAGLIEEAAKYVDIPADIGPETSFDVLDLCSLLEFARYEQKADAQTLAKAWSYTVAAWSAKSFSNSERNLLVPRLVTLLAAQPVEQGQTWITTMARQDHSQIDQFMATVLNRAETAYRENDYEARAAILPVTTYCGNALSDSSEPTNRDWTQELQLLAVPWLNEALKASDDKKRLLTSRKESEVVSLDQELLLRTAPTAKWLDKLSPDTAAMARRLKGLLGARNAAWDTVQETATALAEYDPKTAQSVIDSYLKLAVRQNAAIEARLDELMRELQGQRYNAAQLAQYRQYYRQQLREESGEGEGIALTRANQVQALRKLHEMLKTIAASELPAPSADALTDAFIGAHSLAEVFTREDLETVFGPLTELSVESTASLGQKMRECLAQRWRAQRIQQAAGTNRNEIELSQEVTRGYELAIELVESCANRNIENVKLNLLAGLLLFDQSEYLYGQGADLPTYIKLRDRAFANIERAADSYAKTLEQPNPEPSIEVFQRWFQVALGASDLAYLTRQSSADEPQIQKIAASIRSLGEPMSDEHLAMFGAAFEKELKSVPPALKQRCLRESLTVLGDHPAGNKARELNAYYQQLLEEVELHTAIDGSHQVGHGKPFGMQVSVRYSTPLGREADDFISLLDKQLTPSGAEVNNKKKLEEEIRTKLSESFTIEELRFHPPTAKRRDYGREGWRETPLAYLVLSAKDPAIDTIAPLQVDVLFRDGHGSVLLPIASQKLLIDAREKEPAQRPLAELQVKQLLDARELQSRRNAARTGRLRHRLGAGFEPVGGYSNRWRRFGIPCRINRGPRCLDRGI